MSWRTFAAALADPQRPLAGLSPDWWAIGHSTATTAVALQQDGTLLADRPDSPSLAVLRDRLTAWDRRVGLRQASPMAATAGPTEKGC
ncbi:hypothetical protein [Streptomyces halobius]|uniref:Uncharacterized protein n=1 Tax=Streptomyces halobius TaxID=2879846 RepID=A0ABY4M2W8_9ACTN|nr:hypothetical protein [Streptomyces halobius]UQA90581.1 hypothetical protein K9S39_00515 [Streptomyces halobius]